MFGVYVSRRVLEPEQLLAWAWRAGFRWSLDPTDLHVTVMYSETGVVGLDPDVGLLDLQLQRARLSRFGEATVLELMEGSQVLHDRHEELLAHGGTRSFSTYRPHVTITYRDGRVRLPSVRYAGRLKLGPEEWRQLRASPEEQVSELPLRRHDRAARIRLAESLDAEELRGHRRGL